MKSKIFVINMDRSPDRLELIKAQLGKLNLDFERVVGVDASKLTMKEIQERYSIEKSIDEFYRPLHLGEIGCYISHQNAWQKIIDDDLDFAIILEDDVTLLESFPDAIDFMSKHSDKWQFLRLQNEVKRKKLYNIDLQTDSFSIVEYIKTSGCTAGYVMTKKSAKTLLKALVPFGISADTNMHLYDKYGIEVKALRPYVVYADFEHASDNLNFATPTQRRFSKSARRHFSTSSYKIRLKYLLRRDGFLKLFFRLFKMLFKKKIVDAKARKSSL